MYNTLLSALYKSANWDHWRFLISDMWDAIRGVQHYRGKLNTVLADTVSIYVTNISEAFWGRSINVDLTPENGGVALGETRRTLFGLNKALVEAEKFDVMEAIPALQLFKIYKQSITNPIVYAPWKRFPKGRTRDSFKFLGKFEGINHELSALADKVRNKFVIENDFYINKVWLPMGRLMEEARNKPKLENNFWTWAKEQRWSSYAIPSAFVLDELETPSITVFPFARVQKKKPQYSLPSMMVGYIQTRGPKKTQFPLIEREYIDFSKYTQYEAPIEEGASYWKMISNMKLIGQLTEFADPRKALLDYCSRNRCLIRELDLKDRKGIDTLNLMRKAYGCPYAEYDWATWYTPIPCPVKNEWNDILTSNIPIFHPEILVALDEGTDVETTTSIISVKQLEVFKRNNGAWWKAATTKQRQYFKERKKREKKRETFGWQSNFVPDDKKDPMRSISMDDVEELYERFSLKPAPKAPAPVVKQPDWFAEAQQAIELPSFEWTPSAPEEYVWDPEPDEEDYESLLAADYQDRDNAPSWEIDDPG